MKILKEDERLVWKELAQSERMCKDIQHLYFLKSRKQRNLKRFMKNIEEPNRKSRALYYSVAAVVMVLLGISALLRSMLPDASSLSVEEAEVLIPQIHYDISLKLSSGRNCILTDSHVSFFEPNGINISTNPQGTLTYDDKACAEPLPDSVLYNELIVPRGRECEVILSDQTYIKLNSQSKLKYPVSFRGKKVREVFMEGEAYMHVSNQDSLPFIVHTPRTHTQVLGSCFNIRDYGDEESAGVSLVKGLAKVELATGKEFTLKSNEEIVADVRTGSIERREADTEGTIAWTKGLLYFDNRTLGDIAKDLEKKYDISIRFDSKETSELSFMIKAQKYNRVEDVLELLRLTQKVDYFVRRRTVNISAVNG